MDAPRMEESGAIAIIGMAGRFPGARNVEELWELLKEGREAIVRLTEEECRAAGVSEELLRDPNFVRAGAKLHGVELFDADFFGFSPSQATSLDPQARAFLESAWHAMEDAGYDVERTPGTVGVIAGAGMNHYMLRHFPELLQVNGGDFHQTLMDASGDFLTTRVSYKMGFTGPSIALQTACSTSLVAVHLACQSLLNYECDMMLAGGVSIKPPPTRGYLYEEGNIRSPDGHCRAFDEQGRGIVAGNGVGIVVLKRLDEAVASGDRILAIIRSTVVNNDGAQRVGYSAPGIVSQTRLIATALELAGLSAEDVSFVEGHGTGTLLGDSVELTALTQAYRMKAKSNRTHFCALGSIKTNVGHMDSAAGIAGLIKTVLCLQNTTLVPSLHYQRPNPVLAQEDSPFFVSTKTEEWKAPDGRPRCAGVSSFGMGGTNAHVILQEAPREAAQPESPQAQLFPVSARTASQLTAACRNLASHLERHAGKLAFTDVAFTLQTGRKRFALRKAFVAHNAEDLLAQLKSFEPAASTAKPEQTSREVIFAFPGQGSLQIGSCAGLYADEPMFAADLDHCAKLFREHLSIDIRDLLCDFAVEIPPLHDPRYAQPSLFAQGYALGRLWMRWGVRPAAMIGHSLGEFAAAVLSGTLSLEAAVQIVAKRAELVSDVPHGGMLAVSAAEEEIRPLTGPQLSIGAINAPDQCVLSGEFAALDAAAAQLRERGLDTRRLNVSHAFHSPMMERAARELVEAARGVAVGRPSIPYISCVSGLPITAEQVAAPEYWGAHLRQPVQFARGIAHLARERGSILLEVGSGRTLVSLARRQLDARAEFAFVASATDGVADRASLLQVLGELWEHGAVIDWPRESSKTPMRRVGLPGYPFEPKRYWIDAAARPAASPPQKLAAVPPPSQPTALEEAVVAVFREVFGMPDIGLHDSFLTLGGDSLTALRVLSRFRDQFGVRLSPQLLMSGDPTPQALTFELVSQLARQVPELAAEQLSGLQ